MIKTFETYNDSGLKAGDYVYPKTQYCGRFNVLKPIRYKISRVFTNNHETLCSLDDENIFETFPVDYFKKETPRQKKEYELRQNINKYNM